MKNSKKLRIVSILTAMILMAVSFAGCSTSAITGNGNGKLKIVTTIFPIYDWTTNVLGDNPGDFELTMLLNNGVDLHSFQPTAEDIMKIATCDIFIYVGGESDEWVEDVLSQAVNKDMKVVNLMDIIGDAAKEEELVEGMQESEHEHEHEDAEHEEEHEHEDADHEEGHDHEEAEYDEHIWLSLRNAQTCVDAIATALSGKDSDHADVYRNNAMQYNKELDALDGEYREVCKNAAVKTLLFGDRFPFRYMTDDYGLTYYAAFIGCSAETEASFETVTFLAEKTEELGLRNIMVTESTDGKIAETIISNTKSKDQNILKLDSMQAVTSNDVSAGTTYLSIMKSNLEILKEALGE